MSEHNEIKTLEQRHQMSDLERLRHSCAHVLATAICRLWPDAQLAGGPAVDNGFYYDVELDHRISPEDFERIEEEMKKRGAVNAIMSGSGPTVFGLFINPMAAKAAYDALRFGEASGLAKQVYLTNFYNNL